MGVFFQIKDFVKKHWYSAIAGNGRSKVFAGNEIEPPSGQSNRCNANRANKNLIDNRGVSVIVHDDMASCGGVCQSETTNSCLHAIYLLLISYIRH